MPCMCGDICCPSCGPAQGNSRCILCGAWASEEECVCTPEQLAKAAENDRLATEAEYQDYLEAERLAEEYWSQHDHD